jgi:hypothetical protein
MAPSQPHGDINPNDAERTRVRAARALGSRMDHAAEAIARTPGWLVKFFVFGALLATFPFKFRADRILGFPLDTWLTLWFGRLIVLGVGLAVLTTCFFLIRGVTAFLEEGRWARKAAGVEVDEHATAVDQVERDAEALSQGADRVRYLEKRLKQAQSTIRYLNTELDRERGLAVDEADLQPRANEEDQ